MAFAELTFRESLRELSTCLRAHHTKLYHLGIRGHIARSTLAEANEKRDWRIYHDFAHRLIGVARKLYAQDPFGAELDRTAYALDSTTVDRSLWLFPWAHFRSNKAAIKLHTLLDLRGSIPSFIHISDGKLHDVNVLDYLVPEPGSFCITDCGYRQISPDSTGFTKPRLISSFAQNPIWRSGVYILALSTKLPACVAIKPSS